ncbi:Ubiquitin-conjugating enzyme E2 [Rhizoctonia solani]|uniref:Ubiquitin-conjugating enzyme E2 n=1 Tax=Rhizoctonia solani TaxID=456999 RepID=A0A8H7I752_9AGAM|nr:Ubiquitin-conjugating enzyme E2 [Rhizoctonia solani]
MVTPAAFRKLVKEIQQLRAEPPEGIRVVPSEENMLDITGIIAGPEGTPYAGGYYHIHFSFPPTFPASPPSARMLTKIFHPNVSRSGEICAKMWNGIHATPKVAPVEFQTPASSSTSTSTPAVVAPTKTASSVPENTNASEPASPPKSKLEIPAVPIVQQTPLQPSAVGNAASIIPETVTTSVKPPSAGKTSSASGTENGAAGVVKTTAKRVATGGVEKKKKALKRL